MHNCHCDVIYFNAISKHKALLLQTTSTWLQATLETKILQVAIKVEVSGRRGECVFWHVTAVRERSRSKRYKALMLLKYELFVVHKV